MKKWRSLNDLLEFILYLKENLNQKLDFWKPCISHKKNCQKMITWNIVIKSSYLHTYVTVLHSQQKWPLWWKDLSNQNRKPFCIRISFKMKKNHQIIETTVHIARKFLSSKLSPRHKELTFKAFSGLRCCL